MSPLVTDKNTTLPKYWEGVTPTFYAFQAMRQVWTVIRYGKILSNTKDAALLGAGHLFEWSFGDNRFVQATAKVLYVSTITMQCYEQHKKLKNDWDSLFDAMNGKYERPCKVPHKSNALLILDGKTIRETKDIYQRVTIVALAILNIVYDVFVLVMLMLDAKDALSMDEASCKESVQLLFVNYEMWRNWTNKRAEVMQQLQENNQLLSYITSETTKKDLLKMVDTTLGSVKPKQRISKQREHPWVEEAKGCALTMQYFTFKLISAFS